MPKKLVIYIFIACLFVFSGCVNKQDETKTKDINSLQTQNNKQIRLVNQNIANQAVENVLKMDHVTDAVAVNSQKEIFLAYRIKHMARFRLEKIESDVKKKLEKQFPDYKVTVSSDLKLFLETTKLANKATDNQIENKELKVGIKELKKLKSEKT